MQFLTEPEPPRFQPAPVAPGITRIVAPNPGPMTYRGTNTYLVDTQDGVLVVDPGPDDPAHIEAVLRAAGPRIAAILLTHTHQDHVAGLPRLRTAARAPVAAWRSPADPAIAPDLPLADGDQIGPWRALHTPGHASDHLCFLGPEGITLSGDHVMSWSTTVVGGPGGDMADYFRSLERLLGRQAAMYLPGHGPPLPRPNAYVQALLQHRQEREASIVAALGPDPQPAAQIAARLYPDLDLPLRRAAERNVAAHLRKLQAEGAACETASGWKASRRAERSAELPRNH